MNQYARECILNRKDYIPGKPIEEVQKEFGITDIIKMASNENPMGTSPKAIEAMIEEVKTNSCRYPVSLCTELAGKLAKRLGVAENQIYIDNGGDAVITMYGLTFFNPDDEIVTADTTFPAYENITTKMGATIKKIPLTQGGYFDLPAMLKAVTEKTKTVFICSPNNPTGPITPKKDIIDFLDKVPSSTLVFLDEAYIDFSSNPSFLRELETWPNLVVLQTLSKAWGAAAIRLGMAFASPEIIAVLNKIKYPYNVNLLTQEKALELLDPERMKVQLNHILQGRSRLRRELASIPIVRRVYPTDANFFLVDVGDADRVYQDLVGQGIIVRNRNRVTLCRGCLRITVGTEVENMLLIAALKRMQP